MTQAERDDSLRRHLAEKVMGWHIPAGCRSWYSPKPCRFAAYPDWNPLDSWADAGMVWEKAQGIGIKLELRTASKIIEDEVARVCVVQNGWEAALLCGDHVWKIYNADSGPRAISKAVSSRMQRGQTPEQALKATEWEETK